MTDKFVFADMVPAENCQNMVEVRAGVDAIDAALITLLTQRFAFMDAAARIKTDRDKVRDEARKAAVIGRAMAMAKEREIPAETVRNMWEQLVEGSIAYELDKWDCKRG
jgi:isochorismate pyruvate lyase